MFDPVCAARADPFAFLPDPPLREAVKAETLEALSREAPPEDLAKGLEALAPHFSLRVYPQTEAAEATPQQLAWFLSGRFLRGLVP
ncbi:MAG: hypothetical protein M0Z27_02390 [Thermaerobacter sp.]|nr:hypothetical protein [Thermaerobacter sp.]